MTATSADLAVYRTLVDQNDRAVAELAAIRASIDAELAAVADSHGVTGTARILGLSREEVHRRIRRHRRQ